MYNKWRTNVTQFLSIMLADEDLLTTAPLHTEH